MTRKQHRIHTCGFAAVMKIQSYYCIHKGPWLPWIRRKQYTLVAFAAANEKVVSNKSRLNMATMHFKA